MNGFEFYKVYSPLKLHFTQDSYDGFKYNWKSPAVSYDKFTSRRDRGMFERWANKINNSMAAGQLIIANFMYNSDDWLYHDITDAQDIYQQWKKVRESVTKTCEDDINELGKHSLQSWDAYLKKTPKGNTAPLLQLYLAKRVHPETLCIINNFDPIFKLWEAEYDTDPLIRTEIKKLLKYIPFVKYNRDKVELILREFAGKNETTV